MVEFQKLHYTVNTSFTRCIKIRHIISSSITSHIPNNLIAKEFNLYQFVNFIYITYKIITEIIIIFNFYGVTATPRTTFVPLYCCNNNGTLKTAAIAAETC